MKRVTRATGDFVRHFATEDGQHYRTERQEIGPAMRRANLIRQAQAAHGTGRYDRRYVGSIPINILWDWLKERGFTMDQYARNDGGDPYKVNPAGGGIKDQFIRHFLSRDYAKLHTQHTTTRPDGGEGKIIVPTYIGGNKREDLRRTTDGSQ